VKGKYVRGKCAELGGEDEFMTSCHSHTSTFFVERHVTADSSFIFSCLSDFEMMLLVIHEQTELVVVGVVTRDSNYTSGSSFKGLCPKSSCHVRFEVSTAVTMKNGVFRDVTSCGSCKNRGF
jgi:hypothetical protein